MMSSYSFSHHIIFLLNMPSMSTLRLTSARPALRASGPAFRLSQTSVRRGAPLVRAMEGGIATLVGGITLGGLTGAALGALNGRVSTLETGGSASSSSSSASAVRPVTKAGEYPFRPTAGEAMSYFVGGKVVDNGYAEDGGFAINGGKGWASCVYKNHKIELVGGIGIAMGTYDFTDATDGSVSTVEYTFGYRRCDDGKVRIFLHHSSVPYGSGSGPAPVTEAEVLDVQKNWAAAIAGCSKIYKDGGDYIGAAAEAAGELYAYGHSNVLFKPTKAREYPFRPT